MNFIDCHLHIPDIVVNKALKIKSFSKCAQYLQKYKEETKIKNGICIVMNEKIWNLPNLAFKNFEACGMFDFRKIKHSIIKKAHKKQCRGIKIHPYIQKITLKDKNKLKDILKIAENLGWYVIVDTSYGGENIYKYNPLEIAFFVAENFKNDIVLAHGGGRKILDGFLVAEEFANVWLEYSLTLPYYQNSSIWKDISFVIKKYKAERILFGSDSPYVDFQQAKKAFNSFAKQYKITDIQKRKILWANPRKMLNKYYEK